MTKTPLISVIIVSWNVSGSLHHCLESVAHTKYPNLEVIVIDNASADASVSVIKEFNRRGLPNSKRNPFLVQLIINPENLGFPKAVNQGLDKAKGDYILLLNPDTRISPDFFIKSVQFFIDYPDAAIMGPELLNIDGTVQGSVFREPSVTNTLREFWLGQRGLTAKYSPLGPDPVAVDAISGACLFMPRQTLDRIGKLTEEVFMYYEDLDYCRRIRFAGWRVYFNPQIKVIHEHGKSSEKAGDKASEYLTASSIWYNGKFKHCLMWFISWTGQKLQR